MTWSLADTLSRLVRQLMMWVFSRAGAASRYISAHCLLLVLPVLSWLGSDNDVTQQTKEQLYQPSTLTVLI